MSTKSLRKTKKKRKYDEAKKKDLTSGEASLSQTNLNEQLQVKEASKSDKKWKPTFFKSGGTQFKVKKAADPSVCKLTKKCQVQGRSLLSQSFIVPRLNDIQIPEYSQIPESSATKKNGCRTPQELYSPETTDKIIKSSS